MKVMLLFCIFFLCGKKINLHIWRRECHPNFIIQVSLSDLDSLMIRRISPACVWQACDECHKHACKACNAGANGKALIILHWLNGRHGEKQARSRNAKREGRGEEQVCTRRKKWQERLRLPSYFPAHRFQPVSLNDWLMPWSLRLLKKNRYLRRTVLGRVRMEKHTRNITYKQQKLPWCPLESNVGQSSECQGRWIPCMQFFIPEWRL